MPVNTRQAILSILAGILSSAMILVILCFFFFFFTFNLAGGETIQQVENQNTAVAVIAILLLILCVYFIKRLLLTNKRFTAYGIMIVALPFFVQVTFYYVDNFVYHQSFDKVVWDSSFRKPLGMAAELVEEIT